jgi:uncharacterized protein YecT (DUF1311 family)
VRVLLVSLLLAAQAASGATDDNAIECNGDGTQREMNACAIKDYEAADKALNEKYQALMARLPPEKQQSLRVEQRAWLKKRDPDCKAEAKPSEGGSIWAMEYYSCLAEATQKRTKALDR